MSDFYHCKKCNEFFDMYAVDDSLAFGEYECPNCGNVVIEVPHNRLYLVPSYVMDRYLEIEASFTEYENSYGEWLDRYDNPLREEVDYS